MYYLPCVCVKGETTYSFRVVFICLNFRGSFWKGGGGNDLFQNLCSKSKNIDHRSWSEKEFHREKHIKNNNPTFTKKCKDKTK